MCRFFLAWSMRQLSAQDSLLYSHSSISCSYGSTENHCSFLPLAFWLCSLSYLSWFIGERSESKVYIQRKPLNSVDWSTICLQESRKSSWLVPKTVLLPGGLTNIPTRHACFITQPLYHDYIRHLPPFWASEALCSFSGLPSLTELPHQTISLSAQHSVWWWLLWLRWKT